MNFSVIRHSFRAFGFEGRGIAFNGRDAAAFACIGGWALPAFCIRKRPKIRPEDAGDPVPKF